MFLEITYELTNQPRGQAGDDVLYGGSGTGEA